MTNVWRKRALFGLILLMISFTVAGCVLKAEPTATPQPTSTLTSSPTVTETPTPTATIPPTKTLKPTWTPRPSWTPKPTATPMTTPGADVTCPDCIAVDSFNCSIAMSLTYLADQEGLTSCEKVDRFIRMWAGSEYAEIKYRDPEWLSAAIEAYMEKLEISGDVDLGDPAELYELLVELIDVDSISMVVVQFPDELHAMLLYNLTEEGEYIFFDPMWREYWTPFTATLFEQEYGYAFEDVWLITYNIRRD